MIVEELVSVLGLEIGGDVFSTLDKFKTAVEGGLGGLAAIGAAAAAAFTGIVASVAMAGDEINDTAERLGIATDRLQELKYAADQSDVKFEDLTSGLKFLAKNAYEAANGSEEMQKAFKGISLKNADGQLKSIDELMTSTIDHFQGITNPTERAAAALKIFGRGGLGMINMLKVGNAGLAEFIKDGYELNAVLDEDTVKAGDRFDQQMKRVRTGLEGLRNAMGAPFVGDFADGLADTVDVIKKLIPFVKRMSAALADAFDRMHRGVETVKKFGNELLTWGSDSGLGKFIKAIYAGTDGMKIFEAVVIGLGVTLVATGLATAASWMLAVAPFVLMATFIGLLVDDINTFVEGGDSVLGTIQKWAEAIGEPDEHPFVRFLRTALALVLDVTDIKRWHALNHELLEISNGLLGFDEKRSKQTIVTDPSQLKPYTKEERYGTGAEGKLREMLDPFPDRVKYHSLDEVDTSSPGNLFSGGAANPQKASFEQGGGSITVIRNASYNVNANGMTPEQLKSTLDAHEAEQNRSSMPAVSR